MGLGFRVNGCRDLDGATVGLARRVSNTHTQLLRSLLGHLQHLPDFQAKHCQGLRLFDVDCEAL